MDEYGFPKSIWRFLTAEALKSLVDRLDLPYSDWMQDPELLLADPDRIEEFLEVYDCGDLSDDEKFLLMDIIIHSFNDESEISKQQDAWKKTLNFVEQNIELHLYTVIYWSCFEPNKIREFSNVDSFSITPEFRVLFERIRTKFDL